MAAAAHFSARIYGEVEGSVPFQDANGNFHEASVIHTLQRPSFWQVNTIH